ncbi:MAG: hypothetical protein RJB01_660 [Actinomycetota bacterium]
MSDQEAIAEAMETDLPAADLESSWFADELEDGEEEATWEVPRRNHWVTAIVVTKDGATWLPGVLTTLAEQVRAPDAVVGVDNASSDSSALLLEESLGAARVVRNPVNAGFGGAVDEGVRLLGSPIPGDDLVEWLWLLHDDSAPDPACLDALLLAADMFPTTAILGPKILGWHDRRLLLEVGVTVNADGRRITGLERREHDQGQHDGVREVLAVSTAGMLIRREVFEELKGFDPHLPLFRDDLDLCWRAWQRGHQVRVATDAIVHHREASAHGRRAGEVHPLRDDREAGAQVLLAHAPAWQAPFVALRLLIGSALRGLVYVVGKDLRAARDEVMAVVGVAIHPGDLVASRSLAREGATESAATVRALRPTTLDQLKSVAEAVGGYLTTSSSSAPNTISALESGPTDESAAYLADDSAGVLRRFFAMPGVVLTLVLVLLALIASRTLWWGDGVISGGALLPAPAGASDLWSAYTAAWHNIGPGSITPAPGYLIVLASAATLFLGKVPWVIALLVMLAVPAAGLSAYIASRGLVSGRFTRVWMSAAYALLPAMTGAVASGRIGTTMAAIALPFALRSLWRLTTPRSTTRRAAGTALLMSVVFVAVPGLWLIIIISIGLVILALRSRATRAFEAAPHLERVHVIRLLLACVAPLVVALPWSLYVLTHPVLFFTEPGLATPALVDPQLRILDVVLLHPGGPGMTPLWVSVGIVAAALVAWARRDRRALVAIWWLVGMVALLFAVVQVLITVTPPGYAAPIEPWPGPATLLWGLAAIAAAGIASQGARQDFIGINFTLWQPVAGVVAILALLAPIASAVWWVPGNSSVVQRAPTTSLPAFVVAESTGPQAPRSLLLASDRAGAVNYSLINGGGMTLGDADMLPESGIWDELDPLVAAMVSGRGGPEIPALAGYGVRYVILDSPDRPELVATLDSEPGLRRLSSADGVVLWRVSGVTSRARIIGAQAPSPLGLAQPATVGLDPYVDQIAPEGSGERAVIVGASAAPGWRATADGADLGPVVGPDPYAWSAAFFVPEGTPQVVIEFDDTQRTWWMWFQLIAIAALVILSLPSRSTFDPDPDAELEAQSIGTEHE